MSDALNKSENDHISFVAAIRNMITRNIDRKAITDSDVLIEISRIFLYVKENEGAERSCYRELERLWYMMRVAMKDPLLEKDMDEANKHGLSPMVPPSRVF